jgi:hypothetical protein
MSFICARGHTSFSDDYCDVCGAKNRNVMQRFMSDSRLTPFDQVCPTCGTPREGQDRYCPNCAYDFETGERFEPARVLSWPGTATKEAAAATATGLVLALSVDASRPNEQGCPQPPADTSEHLFLLDQASMVIGRSDAAGLQIPISGDPYVSRHHAEVIRLDDGWGVRDLGSTNGTKLNGTPLAGTEVKRIEAGDVIELGCFSKLTVRPGRAGSER